MTSTLALERSDLVIHHQRYHFVDLTQLLPLPQLQALPFSLRVLLENVALRSPEALPQFLQMLSGAADKGEVEFYPDRLMFHDTTCLPALADFAAMRDLTTELGGDATAINPRIPAVLTIDHSVIVESYASASALEDNLQFDFRRNAERYRFIRWAEKSLDNFRVIPPGTGIIHLMNLETIAEVVTVDNTAPVPLLHADCMIATDSHTPMINALGILGWGVGGLEGQAALVGEPVTLSFPEVIGISLSGALSPDVSDSDLALHITRLLRETGVVGKFVEFTGPALASMSVESRATIANMAPEYGATVVFFPFDERSAEYVALTGRSEENQALISAYMQAQHLWRTADAPQPEFSQLIALDLSTIEPCMAGPVNPHQQIPLGQAASSFTDTLSPQVRERHWSRSEYPEPIRQGAVAIAAITSCTTTANPWLIIQAALFARNAARHGLRPKPWVKTSFSPGSRAVTDYLSASGLLSEMEKVGFDVTGYGCMTCIGSSGALQPAMEALVSEGLQAVCVLSGNRNFPRRVNPSLGHGYLTSPALVIAWAIAGHISHDMVNDLLGVDEAGRPLTMRDLMPSREEVEMWLGRIMKPEHYIKRRDIIWQGTPHWQQIVAPGSVHYPWEATSTYLRRPGYLERLPRDPAATLTLSGAHPFLWLGDDVTTDHISPAGAIPLASLAGQWLVEHHENPQDLNLYSTRRSNHEVMVRGAFTNTALVNRLLPQAQRSGGGKAWDAQHQQILPAYEAAQSWLQREPPLVIFAGERYGAGSSRDWAAKAQALLGVKAVVAHSFERIHRTNLIGMGILPLHISPEEAARLPEMDGREEINVDGLDHLQTGCTPLTMQIRRGTSLLGEFMLTLTLDSQQELRYLRHGGILPYVIQQTLKH
ncbi:aconitate hydratase [Enterobacter hormaechei]|uniref:aconitate hydratase n=1 Tax=Enterobacter hormaechei TaxID=158836 RepID=UPI0012B9966A|nr:aconitate hydratase AcnA [Enterobacter hormaechei]MCL8180000.1 aconitate hydratase AcnA [Enterobacter hormaechei]MCM7042160.1 aconitate hydratase AcnA [Enterobacter hormaechei]MCM7466277.1 aconitate hydratase AcnA [Enterobacter hormaechei]MCW4691748.1 aconitate hydratase AcnA [Enterobacter hormaechei subsp. hoffmannii]MCW4696206.1 aconitate hydratase AcnA [Enterobacter hormaechei subsp. hoffmannii]